MSDQQQSVNDHSELTFAMITPERVVNAGADERLELHRMTLEAGATGLAGELERWMPTDQLVELSSPALAELERVAVTSELAARCVAQLRYRAELEAAGRYCHSPLAAAPPAVRANYTPAQRLELANYCGPADARTCPMDTGKDHAPAGNVHRVTQVQSGSRGWLVASSANGARSLVIWRRGGSRPPAPARSVPSIALRLGWQR